MMKLTLIVWALWALALLLLAGASPLWLRAWSRYQKWRYHRVAKGKGAGFRFEPVEVRRKPSVLFGVSHKVELGLPCWFMAMEQPDCPIKVQRMVANAAAPGMFRLWAVLYSNLNVISGIADAWQYRVDAVADPLDLPTLTPRHHARVIVEYTGFVPVGWKTGEEYTFNMTMNGYIPGYIP